eukprot:symbB.v1.2.004513.t1/scaffold252.1/size382360/7
MSTVTIETRRTLKFTKMCKHFSTKKCFMGNECNFAHSQEELRTRPDLAATGLCYQFMSKGTCKRGAACTFAHGRKELREMPDSAVKSQQLDASELRAVESLDARLDSSSPTPVAPLQQMFIPPLAPVLPALPLLPIDDLLLSAGGLGMPCLRPPPGLPPPMGLAAALGIPPPVEELKVPSDPNSPTTVGSDHVGWGDFSCSSSEVGDQVFDLKDDALKLSNILRECQTELFWL